MALSIQRYMEKGRKYRVLDFGSGTSPRQTLTHRSLLGEYDCDYTGVDIREGNNIDLVMKKPYSGSASGSGSAGAREISTTEPSS
jgi:hypothetical protein